VEWLAAEYHISFADAIWETPLAIALVIMPIRNERLFNTSGPSYIVRASLAAKNKAHAFLAEHFTIVPKPPSETGWKLGTHTYLQIP
jgi:hypothetical protein